MDYFEPRKYDELRTLLFRRHGTQRSLADALGRSTTYVSHCMTGKITWGINEVYAICNFLQIDPCEIPKYFPADDAPPVSQKEGTAYNRR